MKRRGVTAVFGFGESLGGAILLQSLARGADFRALAVESVYSSLEAVADERVGRIIPKFAAFILVREALLYTYLRYGIDLRDAAPDVAIQSAHIPVLLIHGDADNETAPENSRRLAKENPRWTTLWSVPSAKHTGAFAAAPEEFPRRVLQWFAQPHS